MLKRLKLLSLLGCIILMSSCTPIEFFTVWSEVVEHYPADNSFEDNVVEPFIEEVLDMEPGSLDVTPGSPEIKASV